MLKCSAAAAALLLFASPAAAIAQSQTHSFDIPGQDLASAVRAFGRASGQQIAFDGRLTEGRRSTAVVGTFTAEEGLTRLLAGSGLAFRRGASGVLVLVRPEDGPFADGGDTLSSTTMAEVVVTGTRLRGVPSTSPVITFDREAIAAGGFASVQDLMSRVPQNFGSTTPGTGTSGGNFGLTTQIDLRGFGSQATLTLVNGRRVAAAAGNQGRAFDIGMIPVGAISRLDILTDGASALYGSDAIGGVVNLVLRRNFDGAESTVQYGAGAGGRDNLLVSQLVGRSWSSGFVLAAAQYDRRDAVTYADAGYVTSDFRARGGGDFRTPGFGSPGTVYSGSYFEGRPFATLTEPSGTPVMSAVLPAGDGRNLQLGQLTLNQITVFDQVSTDIAPSQENASVYLTAEQEIGAVTVFADGVFARREGEQRLSLNATYLPVPTTNAFSPFAEPVLVGYVFDELGPIRVRPLSEGWFVNLGARGRFGASWTWEVVGSRSRDKFSTHFTTINQAELMRRLASPDRAVAFNPFGDGSGQSAGVIAALLTEAAYSGISELQSVATQAQGELFTLPAGPARLALGAEYREEELDTRGAAPGRPVNVLFPNATREAGALFAELNAPVLAGTEAGGLGELTFNLAARYDRYSDFGDTLNPKVGVLWRPTGDLVLKANWGTSFRAPALRELYTVGLAQPNYGILDPRAPGGPRTVFVSYFSGGNPDLEPEEAETWTVSGEYRPAWLTGARASIGYFRTDYSNRIRGAAEGTTAAFLLTIEDRLPEGVIQRRPDGTLSALNLINLNSARTVMSGWDFDLGYSWTTEGFGAFDLGFAGTVLTEYEDQIISGAPVLDRKGTVGNPPDWRGRLTLGWRQGPWGATAAVNHVDGLHNATVDPRLVRRAVDSQATVDVQLSFTPRDSGSIWTDGLSVRMGATNLFDEAPPFVDVQGLDPRNHNYEGRLVYVRLSKSLGGAP